MCFIPPKAILSHPSEQREVMKKTTLPLWDANGLKPINLRLSAINLHALVTSFHEWKMAFETARLRLSSIRLTAVLFFMLFSIVYDDKNF